MATRFYVAIDLKSFYASVECVQRGLDPLTTNLVVADVSRTEKTICLAASPSLKSYGIAGRSRLFEVIQKVQEVNAARRLKAPDGRLTSSSYHNPQVLADPSCELSYIVAPPQMRKYMEVSARIYEIYLKYVAPEDIHVYSIDEVFIDVTDYLPLYRQTAHELTMTMIRDVLDSTGITATAGIGTNLYLAKVAMDIVAKHISADRDGVRIAELDEMSYRRQLWNHKPLTDFWRIGRGTAKKLAEYHMYTMGDIARCSEGKAADFYNERLLYKLFGINAELLIDHAWGWEPCTMADIKAYMPTSNSLSSGQVLPEPYQYEQGRLIVREMTDLLVLDMVSKNLVTDQMVLYIGYDRKSLTNADGPYDGKITLDYYGRRVPSSAHGSVNLSAFTSSTDQIVDNVVHLYNRIVDPALLIRRINVTANHVTRASDAQRPVQLSLFDDAKQTCRQEKDRRKERSRQQVILELQARFGKNAVLKGMNYLEGATTIARNNQVGGHKA
ncbi:MAG: DNA methylase [Clostridia bacterium]|nr:DNA methylase [Clostridia bacterium]MBR3553406.1 DNA methylase [Clostridia bacterium]